MDSIFPTARLEAFSDGVIAVIITIMVLELKVPTANGFAGLRSILPTLLIYTLSYTFIGVYWVNHHHLIHRLQQTGNRILWANLIWLFALSLIPFFTGYAVEKHLDPYSATIYSACMLLAGAAFLLLRFTVHRELQRENRISAVDVATARKHLRSLLLYAGTLLVAPWFPRLALGLIAAVTLFWILPTLGLHLDKVATDER